MNKKIFLLLLLCNQFFFSTQELSPTHGNKSAKSILDLQISVEEYLTHELDDKDTAHQLTTILMEDIFNWKALNIPTQEINSIIAFAFGNRIMANGNRIPGPINEALANIIVQVYQETKAPVYAQWEIAQAIGSRIPSDKILVINPTLDAQANVIYLSTAGVASAVVNQIGDPKKLGKAAIIAFADHMYRCVRTSREIGIDAFAPANFQMPNHYDEYSGQPWTRDRFTYLITDIKARISNHWEKLIAQAHKRFHSEHKAQT